MVVAIMIQFTGSYKLYISNLVNMVEW